MNPRNLEPGHYVHDLIDGSLMGPWSRERAIAEARMHLRRGIAEPDDIAIVHITDVTVLPEALPRGGE